MWYGTVAVVFCFFFHMKKIILKRFHFSSSFSVECRIDTTVVIMNSYFFFFLNTFYLGCPHLAIIMIFSAFHIRHFNIIFFFLLFQFYGRLLFYLDFNSISCDCNCVYGQQTINVCSFNVYTSN